MNEGFWIAVAIVVAVFASFVGYEAGQLTIAQRCVDYGKTKIGHHMYVCTKQQ